LHNDSRVLGLINLTANDTNMVPGRGDDTWRLCGNSAGRWASPVWAGIIKSECGHHRRVLLLVAFLRSVCKEQTQPPPLPRLAFVDLATCDARAASKDPAYRLQRTCPETRSWGARSEFWVVAI
jgi:hypothetical protein